MANFEWVTKAHRFVYHHTSGWIGGWLGRPMVLMYDRSQDWPAAVNPRAMLPSGR